VADIAYDSTYAYEGLLTYYGAIPGETPVLKVEIDLTSTFLITGTLFGVKANNSPTCASAQLTDQKY
jgi:hypothetical protein